MDPTRCIACGECAFACPVRVTDPVDRSVRRAVFIRYNQAVPATFQIDPAACLHLNDHKSCTACAAACPAGAIDFNDQKKRKEIRVGSIILAPGFTPFDPSTTTAWGYGLLPDVLSSPEFEVLLAESAATGRQLLRPSTGEPIRKIAFLQCVGSRDKDICANEFCSSICCMAAVKEAVVAQEKQPDLDAAIFFTDLRAHAKNCDRFYQAAREESEIRFIRSRIHGVEPGADNRLMLRYLNTSGQQVEELFDLVVLSVGMEISDSARKIAEKSGIRLSEGGFAETSSFMPTQSSRAGIHVCGAFAGPKDIAQSVTGGSAAAAASSLLLARARHCETREDSFPPERDTKGEPPRIGVFICHCGSNIAATVDVKQVAAHAAGLESVVHVEDTLFACAPDTQAQLTRTIFEKKLNRIVIAACTPRSHEELFRKTLLHAGLNGHFLEIANIRNQDSWVHRDDPASATAKAGQLIRAAVAGLGLQDPARSRVVPVTAGALVIGGGLTGMTAALSLAEQGFKVYLVEQADELGGYARLLGRSWNGEDIGAALERLIARVAEHPKIRLFMEITVIDSSGHVGDFVTTVAGGNGSTTTLHHGVVIIAVGGKRSRPAQYGYGELSRVVSALEFDKLYQFGDVRIKKGSSFVFIQCVGSRDEQHPYCSRVCCTHSVQSAITMKRENPERSVYILYRDMRTYGRREMLYTEARRLGVVFINYEVHGKPEVRQNRTRTLDVEVWDHILHRPLRIRADMVILATAILPNPDTARLAEIFKLPLDLDGFFQEAHPKVRPVDFASQGMFVAGLAHCPKPVEESVAQAQAAAARAATLLAAQRVTMDGITALVEPTCDGCGLCLDVCPYKAITLVEVEGGEESAEPTLSIAVNPGLCTGCGICQGTCPKRGISIPGFTLDQLNAKINAVLAEE